VLIEKVNMRGWKREGGGERVGRRKTVKGERQREGKSERVREQESERGTAALLLEFKAALFTRRSRVNAILKSPVYYKKSPMYYTKSPIHYENMLSIRISPRSSQDFT